jgi:hypothetical protein
MFIYLKLIFKTVNFIIMCVFNLILTHIEKYLKSLPISQKVNIYIYFSHYN